MLIALCLTSVLLRVGQTSTQMPQPVQSSGATCRLYIMPSSAPPSLRAQGTALKPAGARFISSGGEDVHADRRVRAHERADRALRADGLVPDRDLLRDAALFPLRGAGREGAVDRHGRHRQQVALAVEHHRGHALHEIGRRARRPPGGAPAAESARPGSATSRSAASEASTAAKLRVSTRLAALAVGLADRVLDLRDRLLARQDARDREEAGLRDRVDASGEARLLGHGQRVDDVELAASWRGSSPAPRAAACPTPRRGRRGCSAGRWRPGGPAPARRASP